MRAKEIAQLLAQRAEEVAKYIFPNGKHEGNEYCVGSLNGETGKSLKIRLIGEKAGIWSDFATGESGDLLDLFAQANKHNQSLAEAISHAKEWLGVGQVKFESPRPSRFAKPNIKLNGLIEKQSQVFAYLVNERKLTAETIIRFKISENNNQIVFPYYRDDELILVKYLSLQRVDGQKQIRAEPNCEPCLFGWNTIPTNARSIAITEGELDTMSLHQYGYPSLSIPFGAGKGAKQQWIEYEFDRLAVFDEIYLCLDNDDEGKKTIEELIDRLGRHRCRIVKLPFKDANECLVKGMTPQEIKICFDTALTLDPNELKSASTYVQEVIDEFYPRSMLAKGINTPWGKVNGKIAFRSDELSIWCGINGHGKSQFIGQIILHTLKEGKKVCIASLELKPKRLLMRLTRQATAVDQPTEEYIHAVHDWFADKLWIFDLVGTAKTKKIIEVFIYARMRYGIDIFVIDSLMKCDICEDDYRAQKQFLDELCDFKNHYNCHVHLIVHPRKGADENNIPSKLDIKGSGSITDLADNCFTIWRNKKKQEEVYKLRQNNVEPDSKLLEAPDCLWICDKQRNGEWEGKIALWFDPKSFQFLEHQKHRSIRYVDFACVTNK